MSKSAPAHLSVDPAKVQQYILDVLVPLGAAEVWLVGSRSGRKNKVPRPDSDWDMEVMGNELDWSKPLPTPPKYGIHGEAHKSKSVKQGAVMLYPTWKYDGI